MNKSCIYIGMRCRHGKTDYVITEDCGTHWKVVADPRLSDITGSWYKFPKKDVRAFEWVETRKYI